MIFGFVLVVLIIKKNKKSADVGTAKESKTSKVQEFILLGIGGTMDKKELVVPSGGLTIGRDSGRCDLAYPIDEPGISGVHCTVTISGDMVLVKDENSSYGTFYNGQKMVAGTTQSVKSGERFYLAEPQNTFLVTVKAK